MHPRRRTITALAALSATCLCAQDIEQVAGDVKKSLRDPVGVSGALGASSVFYRSFGIAPRRDPFYWVFNANLTFKLFDRITVPFTAVVTQQDKNFTNGLDRFSQPFNQFGLSPRYRWLTVHGGFRSMDFSEYTLSGVIWLGGGVDIQPERSPVSGSAFYGRFVKAVPEGGISGITVSLPAYERRGGGARVRVGRERTFAQFAFLKIADDPASIPFDTALLVTPHENQLLGVSGRHQFARWLSAQAEVAFSMLTKNLFQETFAPDIPYVSDFVRIRPSTHFSKVISSSLDFTPGRQQYSLRYKRVDPDYQSLGAIFLTNDVEEISLGSQLASRGGRISLALSAGAQRNNLDGRQALTSARLIGSANLAWQPAERVSLGFSYSNFSANSSARRDAFTDSVIFVQVTQNGAFNSAFSFGGRCRQQLCAMVNYQEAISTQQPATTFGSAALSYQLTAGESGWDFSLSGVANRMNNDLTGEQTGMGPQLTIRKSMWRNRLQVLLSGGRQENYLSRGLASANISAATGISLVIDAHQQLRADGSYLRRDAMQAGIQSFSEARVTFGYTYRFSASAKNLKNRK